MARLRAEQQLLTLLQTEAVTFRDVLKMCYLWSDMPLTANLWSQLARCSSPLWWLSRRVIQDCGCSAEILSSQARRSSAARKEPGAIAALRRYMELCRSGGVYVSGSQSLRVELGLWLRDKQHELGIQMQWACWERAIGEKFEDWVAQAACVIRPFWWPHYPRRQSRPFPGRGADSVCPAPPIDGRAGAPRDPPGDVIRSHGFATTTWRSAESQEWPRTQSGIEPSRLLARGVDVTCAALSCLRFASDVCPHVSLFQFLQVFDCKGLMSHVPHSAAFGLDQMCLKLFRNKR